MEASNLMDEGLTLMLFGMGSVFVFLTLLVFVTTLMSWIITKIEKNVGAIPDEGVPSAASFVPHPKVHEIHHVAEDDKTLISVLTSAIHKYRSRNK